MRQKWWQWLGLAGAVASGLACGQGQPDPLSDGFDPAHQPGVQDRVSLVSFRGARACEELERHIEDRMVLQMRVALAENKGWALAQANGYPSTGPQGFMADAGAASSGSGGGGGGSGGSAAPAAFTSTNTQVRGVDEPDFVKNDGTRIFVLSGQTLYSAVSWPANSLARVGTLHIEGRPREMFLDGNRLVIFSETYDKPPDAAWSEATQVTFVDASDLAHLRVTQTHQVPGKYRTARRIGSAVRLVVTDRMEFPAGVRTWVEPYGYVPHPEVDLSRSYDQLARSNEQAIRAGTLEQWIPAIRSADPAQLSPLDCEAVGAPDVSGQLGTASVVTLDLDLPNRLSRFTLLAQAHEVYASPLALYIAQQHWWWMSSTPRSSATYLHKLDLSRPDEVAWVGSGQVDGTLVDQFAMGEYQGFLRVATTLDSTSLGSSGNGWRTPVNRLTVFAEKHGTLERVGQSEELAPGERIMSARFVGPKGYIVTFRQTDPLFTFDLSDPTHPRKVGELKVPGFSSYIHPLDDDHLLTIGTFIPEQPSDWRERGVQLAIFDVSDFAHPRQTHTQIVGNAHAGSEAQWEHKAFNYFPERKLLAIPFFDWSYEGGWSSYVSDLRVFRVDANTGFGSLGSLEMRDVLQRPGSDLYGWSWSWQPMVRRSVMADDFVYAISSGGIRVANVANLAQPVATIGFDNP